MNNQTIEARDGAKEKKNHKHICCVSFIHCDFSMLPSSNGKKKSPQCKIYMNEPRAPKTTARRRKKRQQQPLQKKGAQRTEKKTETKANKQKMLPRERESKKIYIFRIEKEKNCHV